MWKLALVSGKDVQVFEADGEKRRQSFDNFNAAIASLLQAGWEPFQAVQGEFNFVVWLRLKIS